MTKTEQRAIQNLLRRLREPNLGCGLPSAFNPTVKQIEALADSLCGNDAVEVVSRIYLDTWIIPALEALIDGAPALAADLTAK